MSYSEKSQSRSRRELHLLGGWRMTHDGGAVELHRREQRLIALLALRGERPRSEVSGTLWPDTSDTKAAASLRTAIRHTQLRAPGTLRLHHGVVGLAATMTVDVHGLLGARDAPIGQPVLGLLERGELLPGWYEDWVVHERAQLELIRLRLLERMAGHALQIGDAPLTLRAARLAAAIEPLHEPVQSLIIRAHLLDDDYVGAVRQYRSFEQLLDDELHIPPSPRLHALVQSFQRPSAGAPEAALGRSPVHRLRNGSLARAPRTASGVE